MRKTIKSNKLDRGAGPRHDPPAESPDDMVQVVPTSRIFWLCRQKVFAHTEGSKVYASGERLNTNPIEPTAFVRLTGDVTRREAIRMLDEVKASIKAGDCPGDFTTGTMSRDCAADSLKVEKEEAKKLKSLMKTVKKARPEALEDIDLGPTGPMCTDMKVVRDNIKAMKAGKPSRRRAKSMKQR
jgi:hypothetical protein